MITFLKRLIASVPTPGTDKVTFFVDSASDAPAFKDHAGTTTVLSYAMQQLVVDAVSSSSAALTLDFADANRAVYTCTLDEDTTLAFDNLAATGYLEYELHITQDGTGGWTLTLPASHKALGGSDTAIASAAGAVAVLAAASVDGGTTWRYVIQESA